MKPTSNGSQRVCLNHEKLLPRSEVRWIAGIATCIIGSLALVMWDNSASVDSVKALDRRIEDKEKAAEQRSRSIEKSMDEMKKQLADIHSFILRSGPSGTRYGGRVN